MQLGDPWVVQLARIYAEIGQFDSKILDEAADHQPSPPGIAHLVARSYRAGSGRLLELNAARPQRGAAWTDPGIDAKSRSPNGIRTRVSSL